MSFNGRRTPLRHGIACAILSEDPFLFLGAIICDGLPYQITKYWPERRSFSAVSPVTEESTYFGEDELENLSAYNSASVANLGGVFHVEPRVGIDIALDHKGAAVIELRSPDKEAKFYIKLDEAKKRKRRDGLFGNIFDRICFNEGLPPPTPRDAQEPSDVISNTNSDTLRASVHSTLTQHDNECTECPPKLESDHNGLHWNPTVERRGLGNVVRQVNHIAITVADVGRSLHFYTDVIGLQQIRRPNFDRHGAWLTMGNIELHLIKGHHVAPSDEDLIVGHISLETDDIHSVKGKLDAMGQYYRQNISVPDPVKSRTSVFEGDRDTNKSDVVQFFIRDPDGYYLEICNCDILTKFCMTKHGDETIGDSLGAYDEGLCSNNVGELPGVAKARRILKSFLRTYIRRKIKTYRTIKDRKKREAAAFSMLAECNGPAEEVDETKLRNLLARKFTYGDITQGYEDEFIATVLQKANNDVPLTVAVLDVMRGEERYYKPPSWLEQNGRTTSAKSFTYELVKRTVDSVDGLSSQEGFACLNHGGMGPRKSSSYNKGRFVDETRKKSGASVLSDAERADLETRSHLCRASTDDTLPTIEEINSIDNII